jgi:murein DD-endopeptidase MepM/ murein hydrolase activator NlpD
MTLPSYADAFWPFSTNADAAVNTFASGSGTPALIAATNFDPNPNKGLGDSLQTSGEALLAFSGPSGTIADVASSTQSDRISVYVVRKGDTLSEIAGMFNVSVNTLIWANNLSSIKDVHPGDTLIILPISGVKRTVVKGDTLKSIAKKYGADATEIAQFNGLDPAETLIVGSVLIIPGGEIAPVVVTNPKSSTVSNTSYLSGGGTAQNGYYSNPVLGGHITQGIHGKNGVDIGLASGAPVRTAADGTVIIARNNGGWNGGYGNYVVITHSNGSQTLYAHLRSTTVSPGQMVSNGQVIGYMGATGKAFGTHLHFEVRGAANPFRFCSVGRACSPQ